MSDLIVLWYLFRALCFTACFGIFVEHFNSVEVRAAALISMAILLV